MVGVLARILPNVDTDATVLGSRSPMLQKFQESIGRSLLGCSLLFRKVHTEKGLLESHDFTITATVLLLSKKKIQRVSEKIQKED